MAVFSDLPNELVIHIWSYVIEPESVERFALVSKRVYGLATPFLREHERLKQQYSRISHSNARSRAADLLETLLLNPRIAHYIHEFRIGQLARLRKDQYQSPLQSYFSSTIKIFETAVRCSSLIFPLEREEWVESIKDGDEAPLIALMIMQTAKVTKFELEGHSYHPHFIVETLGRITQSSEAAIHPGPSTARSEIACRDYFGYSRPPSLSKVSDLGFYLVSIEARHLFRLLQGIRKLKSFSLIDDGLFTTIEPSQICDELLASSQHSLQKLCLRTEDDILDDIEIDNRADPWANCMGDITRFKSLTALETDFVRLCGCSETKCSRLADRLPISIEDVILVSTEVIPSNTLRDMVLQMVECKTVRLPKLKALTFESRLGGKWGNKDPIKELKKKCEDVGVVLSMV